MLETILKKAGIIDYERLHKILFSACKLAKITLIPHLELVDLLINKYCYVSKDTNMLICKSEVKYDFASEKRQISLRDYLISNIEKYSKLSLDKIKQETKTKYNELKVHINELCLMKNEECTFK